MLDIIDGSDQFLNLLHIFDDILEDVGVFTSVNRAGEVFDAFHVPDQLAVAVFGAVNLVNRSFQVFKSVNVFQDLVEVMSVVWNVVKWSLQVLGARLLVGNL